MSDLEIRVVKLENKTDNHDEDIREIRSENKRLDASLVSINKTLEQIKYTILGAVSFLVLQNMGLTDFLKKVIL
jgi:hypothetical protein